MESGNGENVGGMDEDVMGKVVRQLEYYFSDVNLPQDKFLKGKVSDDPDGFVDLSVIMSFKRVAQMKVSMEDLAKAIDKSEMLSLNEDRTRVKRSTPLVELIAFDQRAVYVSGLPREPAPDIEDVRKLFQPFGDVLAVKLRKNNQSEFNGTAFVEYKTKDEVDKAVAATDIKTQEDKELIVLTIADYKQKRKTGEIFEEKPPKEKKAKKDGKKPDKEDREFVKGLVLKLEDVGPGVSREELKEVFGEYGMITWVDFSRDDADGFVRFATEGCADKAKEGMESSKKELGGKVPKITFLEGEPEKEYWENVWTQQENRRKRMEEKTKQKKFGARGKYRRNKRSRGDRDANLAEDDDEDDDHPADANAEDDKPKAKKTKFDSDEEKDGGKKPEPMENDPPVAAEPPKVVEPEAKTAPAAKTEPDPAAESKPANESAVPEAKA